MCCASEILINSVSVANSESLGWKALHPVKIINITLVFPYCNNKLKENILFVVPLCVEVFYTILYFYNEALKQFCR